MLYYELHYFLYHDQLGKIFQQERCWAQSVS